MGNGEKERERERERLISSLHHSAPIYSCTCSCLQPQLNPDDVVEGLFEPRSWRPD